MLHRYSKFLIIIAYALFAPSKNCLEEYKVIYGCMPTYMNNINVKKSLSTDIASLNYSPLLVQVVSIVHKHINSYICTSGCFLYLCARVVLVGILCAQHTWNTISDVCTSNVERIFFFFRGCRKVVFDITQDSGTRSKVVFSSPSHQATVKQTYVETSRAYTRHVYCVHLCTDIYIYTL